MSDELELDLIEAITEWVGRTDEELDDDDLDAIQRIQLAVEATSWSATSIGSLTTGDVTALKAELVDVDAPDFTAWVIGETLAELEVIPRNGPARTGSVDTGVLAEQTDDVDAASHGKGSEVDDESDSSIEEASELGSDETDTGGVESAESGESEPDWDEDGDSDSELDLADDLDAEFEDSAETADEFEDDELEFADALADDEADAEFQDAELEDEDPELEDAELEDADQLADAEADEPEYADALADDELDGDFEDPELEVHDEQADEPEFDEEQLPSDVMDEPDAETVSAGENSDLGDAAKTISGGGAFSTVVAGGDLASVRSKSTSSTKAVQPSKPAASRQGDGEDDDASATTAPRQSKSARGGFFAQTVAPTAELATDDSEEDHDDSGSEAEEAAIPGLVPLLDEPDTAWTDEDLGDDEEAEIDELEDDDFDEDPAEHELAEDHYEDVDEDEELEDEDDFDEEPAEDELADQDIDEDEEPTAVKEPDREVGLDDDSLEEEDVDENEDPAEDELQDEDVDEDEELEEDDEDFWSSGGPDATDGSDALAPKTEPVPDLSEGPDALGPSFLPPTKPGFGKIGLVAASIVAVAAFLWAGFQLVQGVSEPADEVVIESTPPADETPTSEAPSPEPTATTTESDSVGAHGDASGTESAEPESSPTSDQAQPQAPRYAMLITENGDLWRVGIFANRVDDPRQVRDAEVDERIVDVSALANGTIGVVDRSGDATVLHPFEPESADTVWSSAELASAAAIVESVDTYAVLDTTGSVSVFPNDSPASPDTITTVWDTSIGGTPPARMIDSHNDLVPFPVGNGDVQMVITSAENQISPIWTAEGQPRAFNVDIGPNGMLMGVGDGAVARYQWFEDGPPFQALWDPVNSGRRPAIGYARLASATAFVLNDGSVLKVTDGGQTVELWDPEINDRPAIGVVSLGKQLLLLLDDGGVVRITTGDLNNQVATLWDLDQASTSPVTKVIVTTRSE